MSAEFRKLCADDLAEFKALRLDALSTNPESFGSNYTREAAYNDDKFGQLMRADDTRFILGAFIQGNLVAMIGIMDLDQINAQIWGVFTRPETRGQGIAKKLLQRLIEVARQTQSATHVRLGVTQQSDVAIGLYKALGFESYTVEKDSGAQMRFLDCEILMKITL